MGLAAAAAGTICEVVSLAADATSVAAPDAANSRGVNLPECAGCDLRRFSLASFVAGLFSLDVRLTGVSFLEIVFELPERRDEDNRASAFVS